MRLLLAQVIGAMVNDCHDYHVRLGAAVTELLDVTIANLGLRQVSECAEGRHAVV